MTSRLNRRRTRTGFTLMEVLLVLVILVILGSLATTFIRRIRQTALRDLARVQISSFEGALKLYDAHIRSYPSSSQSLQALLERPSGLANPARWEGPYLEAKVLPLDPWDHPYRYELENADKFRIWSVGPDGADGTDDDISNE